MARKICGNCIFFDEKRDPTNVAKVQGVCCEKPPQQFPVGTSQGLTVMHSRPAPNRNDPGCREHRLTVTEVKE